MNLSNEVKRKSCLAFIGFPSKQVKLVRVTDDEAKKMMKVGTMEENPFVPSFYEQPDTYMVSKNNHHFHIFFYLS